MWINENMSWRLKGLNIRVICVNLKLFPNEVVSLGGPWLRWPIMRFNVYVFLFSRWERLCRICENVRSGWVRLFRNFGEPSWNLCGPAISAAEMEGKVWSVRGRISEKSTERSRRNRGNGSLERDPKIKIRLPGWNVIAWCNGEREREKRWARKREN